MNKKLCSWQDKYDKAVEDHDGHFGYNIDFWNPVKQFGKIYDMGATLDFPNSYTVKIALPAGCNNEDLLIFIMTQLPAATEVEYSKKKHVLTMEWHY